jgi:pimeloyl-ACP methyl ester carboxylesterase
VRSWALREQVEVSHGRVAVAVMGPWSFLWRDVAAALARDHTVHLWDLIGYGDSSAAEGVRPSVALHAATLTELVRHWGLTGADAPVLVGHDIGGGAVLRAHLVHGVTARGLVLLDAAVLSPWVTPPARHMQSHLAAYRTMPNPTFHRIIGAHLDTTTTTPLPDEVREAYLGRFTGDEGQQRWLDQVAGFSDEDTREVADRLGQITVPVGLIWGEHDEWLPLETGRRLYAAIPTADLTVVPRAGHFVTEDAPEATASAVRTAVAGTREAGTA